MRRISFSLAFAFFLLLPTSVAAAECQFVLGFATLRDLVGHEIVGECLENEHHNEIGDSVQQTTGGLLVWRKADNWTAFTDGYRTWINGPNGLVQRLNTERFQWEADYAPGGGVVPPTPDLSPTPTLGQDSSPGADSFILVKQAIEGLPWVQDRVAPSETNDVVLLYQVSSGSQQVLQALTQKSWVRDGLTEDEYAVIAFLRDLTAVTNVRRDVAIAQSIVNMPFLNEFDAADFAAVRSLRLLHSSPDRSYLRQVLSRPALHDGITDHNRSLVAVLYWVVPHRAYLLNTLLSPAQVTVEERVITLPRSGEGRLAVVHTSPGTFPTLDILEHALRSQEEFMLEQFPRKFVALLVADATPANGGGNQSGIATIDPGLEEATEVIAHEVAHTYWSYGAQWLGEGGATLLEAVSSKVLARLPLEPLKPTCEFARNILELERIERELFRGGEREDDLFSLGLCPYDFGLGIFLDLYQRLGDGPFRQGFRSLYVKLRDGAHDDVCFDLEYSICYLRFAFVQDASLQAATIAEPIIDRWFYGS